MPDTAAWCSNAYNRISAAADTLSLELKAIAHILAALHAGATERDALHA